MFLLVFLNFNGFGGRLAQIRGPAPRSFKTLKYCFVLFFLRFWVFFIVFYWFFWFFCMFLLVFLNFKGFGGRPAHG